MKLKHEVAQNKTVLKVFGAGLLIDMISRDLGVVFETLS